MGVYDLSGTLRKQRERLEDLASAEGHTSVVRLYSTSTEARKDRKFEKRKRSSMFQDRLYRPICDQSWHRLRLKWHYTAPAARNAATSASV